MSDVCHSCGGYGKEGGCPRCGATPRERVMSATIHNDVPVDLVPQTYHGKLWTKPEVTKDTPVKFKEFDANLEKVLNVFLSGQIPKFSMFIASPPKSDKHLFAYSCIQTSLVQGYSIAPLLSSSDWRRLYKISQMNPFYKLYGKYTWDNTISSDVMFMYIDHSDDRFDVVGLLKDILDTRAMFGRPTFIISDYKLTELVPHWGDKSYSSIHNTSPNRDYNRYPVVIQRFE